MVDGRGVRKHLVAGDRTRKGSAWRASIARDRVRSLAGLKPIHTPPPLSQADDDYRCIVSDDEEEEDHCSSESGHSRYHHRYHPIKEYYTSDSEEDYQAVVRKAARDAASIGAGSSVLGSHSERLKRFQRENPRFVQKYRRMVTKRVLETHGSVMSPTLSDEEWVSLICSMNMAPEVLTEYNRMYASTSNGQDCGPVNTLRLFRSDGYEDDCFGLASQVDAMHRRCDVLSGGGSVMENIQQRTNEFFNDPYMQVCYKSTTSNSNRRRKYH